MAKKPTTNFLTEFKCVDRREEYVWRNGIWRGTYYGYTVVSTEVWEALLADGEAQPASYVNPGAKAVGQWRCEDRGVSDPFGAPLRRVYHETWVSRGVFTSV